MTAVKEFAHFSKSGTRNFRASSLPRSNAATIMNNGKETIQLRLDHRHHKEQEKDRGIEPCQR
jgi:hypothetical protein